MKFLSLDGLTEVVNNIKNLINTSVENTLTNSKKYTDGKIDTINSTINNKANTSALDSHTGNTTVHITSAERTNWNAAKTHADSSHAPSNAEKNQNAFSNVKVGSTTVAADTTTDTIEFVGSNVTITPDATNDKITFTVADGSTSAKGLLQLTNSTSSTSTTTAATPNSVKSAYDLANTAKTNAATAQATADSKVSSVSLASGTNNGTVKLTVNGTATDNIAVKGLGSAAYTESSAYATSGHTHNYAGSSSSGGSANSAVKLTTARTINSVSFDGTSDITVSDRKYCMVGSDTASTSGWYKVASQEMSGYGDTNVTFMVTSTYAKYNSGIFQLQIRSDNTNIQCQMAKWLTRIGFSASDIRIVISGMRYTMYVKQNNTQYGRIMFEVLSESSIHGASSDITLYNSTTPESTEPTATVTSSDGATVASANTASKADKLTTARTIGLSGGATGTATSFDGSANITIPVTSVSPSHIADGYTSKGFYINTHPENSPTIIPFINNDIAFLLKRGGSAVVKYDGVVQDINISNVFDGSPSYWAIDPTNITEVVIELTLHKVFAWTNTVYVDSGSNGWRAKNIKLEVINTNYADDVWTVKSDNKDRTISQFKHTFNHKPVGATNEGGGFNKIRLTFSGWNSATIFRIAAIGIVNYGSSGLRETFLPRDGGETFGSISPYQTESYDLGSSSKKWNNVYAKTFNGTLSGNSSTATKLANARTVQTNLGSTSTASFDGSANITPGITGTLPIANGGTGATTAASALTNLGITATATELNKLDGVTATTAELNYVNGVTSNIQTQLNGKANTSHGNHVPTTQTADNKKFLRNDNTWQTVTPANIGAATSDHTHNYAASDSVNGVALNSDKLDGYHADDFVFLQNFIAGKLGSTTAYYSTSANKDCDSIEDFVALAGGADGLHYPTANNYYYILTLRYATTAKKQIAFGYKGNVVDSVVFRSCNDGTWTGWKQLYTSANITYGTSELTPGTSTLATGSVYYQYE